ncbi:MAG: alpha/beta fold hydrolase [Phaeovulum sp.]|uniref:alpha/beta hydrolase n=1 Tax=Phaeovulum sp. TaxID=2934796 RepID=UPI002736A9CF|nr:alpha/beta fold hydrolase [Phaeovulum sp.]MDP3860815.1 alpha/beta fold hydrolase [Phaeovulum sp.]
MTRVLQAGRRAPASGKTGSAVVFLHGYGADGADLLGLAEPLAQHLPDTLFVAPDAPEPCAGNPFGRQWFPIPRLDGSSEAESEAGLSGSANDLQAFLDVLLEETAINPLKVALVGFSQGSMMALHVAPRRAEALAGVVAFSGRLLRPERLAAEARVKPPVLLIHGDADPMVDFAEMGRAGDALVSAGFDTYAHVMRGTGHGIAPDGLSVALAFLRERLR